MEQAAIYFLKSTTCSLIFLIVYHCFLKNETFYKFNRYFLFGGLVCSLLLPFYTYTYQVEIVAFPSAVQMQEGVGERIEEKPMWMYLLFVIYFSGVFFLLIRNVTEYLRVRTVLRRADSIRMKWGTLWTSSAFNYSFSIFNNIVIRSSSDISEEEKKMVFEHELAHVKQGHWIDLMLGQLFCIINWFNPLAWMYLGRIKQNHEFLADREVLQMGNRVSLYKAALINHTFGFPVFAFASTFADSDRLRRLRMMDKAVSAPGKKYAVLFIFPALVILVLVSARAEYLIKPNKAFHQNMTAEAKSIGPEPNTNLAVSAGEEVLHPSVKIKASTKKNVSLPIKKSSAQRLPGPGEVDDKATVVITQQEPVVTSSEPMMNDAKPLFILDGEEISSMDGIPAENIERIDVLKDVSATAAYGGRGKNGVVIISLKK